jgi:hypothetical protein
MISIVFRDFCQDKFHRLIFSQAGSHSLVLKQLIVSLKVFTITIGFQN